MKIAGVGVNDLTQSIHTLTSRSCQVIIPRVSISLDCILSSDGTIANKYSEMRPLSMSF